MVRSWQLVLVRGIFAVSFALLSFFWPEITVTVFVLLFGVYALMDGLFALAALTRFSARDGHFWALLIEGLMGIAVGIVTFLHPGLTALAIVVLVGAWATLTGILAIVGAIQLRRIVANERFLFLSGLSSIFLGIAIIAAPGAGLLVWVYFVSAYALLFGGSLIGLALRLRKHSQPV